MFESVTKLIQHHYTFKTSQIMHLFNFECSKSGLFIGYFIKFGAWRRLKTVGTKGSVNQSMNQSMAEVFVEQPLALPGSGKNIPSQYL